VSKWLLALFNEAFTLACGLLFGNIEGACGFGKVWNEEISEEGDWEGDDAAYNE
jgi:hypothetical protein